MRALSWALLSGLLLALPFVHGGFWPAAWCAFVPFFLALEHKPKIKVFLLAFLSGIVFWSCTIYWLVHVTLPGALLLIAYLALFFGVFALILASSPLSGGLFLVFVPCAWVLLEYLRGYLLTGFGWALLGYSQSQNVLLIQIADLTGAWGVSFLVMFVNAFLFSIVRPASNRTMRIWAGVAGVLLVVVCYGSWRLYLQPRPANGKGIKISVIQGNIPQEFKWDVLSREAIMNRYLNVSVEASRENPDLIVWPEAALPVALEDVPYFFEQAREFAGKTKTPLLLGAVTQRQGSYYNSAILVDRKGQAQTRYDKLHLVPFGEYIPLKKVFRFLEKVVPIGDFSRGNEYTVFPLFGESYAHRGRFSVLICFEDLFPELARRFVKAGADFLINITNDAWFQDSTAPFQHFQASVFRAVENRVYVVRAANTGVSGFISPEGKAISFVRDESGQRTYVKGYDTEEISLKKRPLSFYTRRGDIFVILCFLYFVGYVALALIRRRG